MNARFFDFTILDTKEGFGVIIHPPTILTIGPWSLTTLITDPWSLTVLVTDPWSCRHLEIALNEVLTTVPVDL